MSAAETRTTGAEHMAQKQQPKKQSIKKTAAPAPAAAKKVAAKAPAKAPAQAAAKAPAKSKGGWAETMKQALANKRPAGGFPDQPKPRDSGVQKVKKNAF
jgi:hypothetical protein